uniref:Uncharacterized protein n=1 Tax=Rhabditophanes sp. KR3021 TaxID=114890 RepID=A0AC35UDL8_9BILA
MKKLRPDMWFQVDYHTIANSTNGYRESVPSNFVAEVIMDEGNTNVEQQEKDHLYIENNELQNCQFNDQPKNSTSTCERNKICRKLVTKSTKRTYSENGKVRNEDHIQEKVSCTKILNPQIIYITPIENTNYLESEMSITSESFSLDAPKRIKNPMKKKSVRFSDLNYNSTDTSMNMNDSTGMETSSIGDDFKCTTRKLTSKKEIRAIVSIPVIDSWSRLMIGYVFLFFYLLLILEIRATIDTYHYTII